MTSSWHSLCDAVDLQIEGASVRVRFRNERSHRVSVEELADGYRISGIVMRRSAIEDADEMARKLWLRNRSRSPVGFRIDRKGSVVGEAWAPKAGLTPAEFQLLVRSVAAECDRLEYVWTGRDAE